MVPLTMKRPNQALYVFFNEVVLQQLVFQFEDDTMTVFQTTRSLEISLQWKDPKLSRFTSHPFILYMSYTFVNLFAPSSSSSLIKDAVINAIDNLCYILCYDKGIKIFALLS